MSAHQKTAKSGPDKGQKLVVTLSADGVRCLRRIQRIMGYGLSVAVEQSIRAFALDPNLAEIDRRSKENIEG